MKANYKDLGKVCITPDGFWNRNHEYERISMVTDPFTGYSYISKKDVPVGIVITNQEYWQRITTTGYRDNNIIILSDQDADTGKLLIYTLQEAINSIEITDRRAGLILGFYGTDNKSLTNDYSWYLYQFNSSTIDDWNKLNCWVSIYSNVEKFKGYFANEELLLKQYPLPSIGDFAFVGSTLEDCVAYICAENGQWINTKKRALNFADKFDAVYSKDFESIVEDGRIIIGKSICENYNSSKIQQLQKINSDNENLVQKNVFPASVLQAIFDAETGVRLDSILSHVNCLYVSFKDNIGTTRLKVDKRLRIAGLIITFKGVDGIIYSQRYIGDTVTDEEWIKDSNWKNCFVTSDDSELTKLIESAINELLKEATDDNIINLFK